MSNCKLIFFFFKRQIKQRLLKYEANIEVCFYRPSMILEDRCDFDKYMDMMRFQFWLFVIIIILYLSVDDVNPFQFRRNKSFHHQITSKYEYNSLHIFPGQSLDWALRSAIRGEDQAANSIVRPAIDKSEHNKYKLYFELCPIIGGPKFLPVHTKLILETPCNYHKWDFIPINATDQLTMSKLIQLQSVPGEIRYFITSRQTPATTTTSDDMNNKYYFISNTASNNNDDEESFIVKQVKLFCDNNYDKNLHLVYNSCWTFGIKLYIKLWQEINTNKVSLI